MLKGVFLDLSGVLYEGPEPLPGAVDAVARLQASGLVLRFVTNTSRRGRQQLLADFDAMGFAIDPSQLVTAPSVTADWLRARQRRPYLLVHSDIRHEFADLPQAQPDTVVIGDAGDALNYANLNDVFRLLLDGAELVATGDNRYFKACGEYWLDAGPFVRALEYAAGVQARVMGKPSADFYAQILADAGLQAAEVIMLGDDIHGDIEGALSAGLQACLVQSGKYRPGDEKEIVGAFSITPSLQDWVAQQGL